MARNDSNGDLGSFLLMAFGLFCISNIIRYIVLFLVVVIGAFAWYAWPRTIEGSDLDQFTISNLRIDDISINSDHPFYNYRMDIRNVTTDRVILGGEVKAILYQCPIDVPINYRGQPDLDKCEAVDESTSTFDIDRAEPGMMGKVSNYIGFQNSKKSWNYTVRMKLSKIQTQPAEKY